MKRNEFRRINQGLKIDESKEIANKNKVTFSSDGTQISEEYTIPTAKLTKIKSSDVLSGYKATEAAKRKECTMEMSSDQYCSRCGASLSPEAKFCPACGKQASTSAPSAQLSESEPTSESPLRKELFKSWIGGLMIIGGLIAAVYFFFFFDTSVEVPTQQIFGQTVGGGRVNNLGLMAQRQNGIIFSFGAAIVGAVIEFFARSRK